MADQRVPTSPAEPADDNNKTEQAAAELDEAEEKDPATRMREWSEGLNAAREWKNLRGPALNEWTKKQAKALMSITKDVLKTGRPGNLKNLAIERPELEQPIDDPEYEERKKKRMAEIKEIWKREESFKPKRTDREEFKWDKNSVEYKKIMDSKRDYLKRSDKERWEKFRTSLKEDVDIKEAAG